MHQVSDTKLDRYTRMMWDKIEIPPCSEMRSGPVCPLLCVWKQYNGFTGIQQQLSYIYKRTQYLIKACMFQTWNLPSHVLQSWVVNLLQFLYSNFNTIVLAPDSSVCGCGLWRSGLSPNVSFSGRGGVGRWKMILHNEVNNLHLSFPGRWSHCLDVYVNLTVYIPCTDESSRCFTIELIAIAMSNINETPSCSVKKRWEDRGGGGERREGTKKEENLVASAVRVRFWDHGQQWSYWFWQLEVQQQLRLYNSSVPLHNVFMQWKFTTKFIMLQEERRNGGRKDLKKEHYIRV